MTGTVIIGAGHAGSQLAVSLRAEGYTLPITLIDADAALPYHKPPLSKTFLKDPSAQPQALRAERSYDAAQVTRLADTVVSIDTSAQHVTLSDGKVLIYTDLVFATGASNRSLPDLATATNVHSLRTLGDAEALRTAVNAAQHFTIIGGGFIGLETAAALASMGKSITVLEAAPRVLARVAAKETSERVEATLKTLGVVLHTNWRGTGYTKDNNKIAAVLGLETIQTDLILVGIGASPNVAVAQAADITCANGILTDTTLATSAAHVWAIGDVACTPHWQTGQPERIESVQNATDQARHLARTLAQGVAQPFRTVPWFWSDIGPLKLQIAGLSTGADNQTIRQDGAKLAIYHLRQGKLISVETIGCAADHMIARRLLEAGLTPTTEQIIAGPEKLKGMLTS
jgi:3-phenylpropionate/trans-cinnamate dioxygenase ferredoxin reductase component